MPWKTISPHLESNEAIQSFGLLKLRNTLKYCPSVIYCQPKQFWIKSALNFSFLLFILYRFYTSLIQMNDALYESIENTLNLMFNSCLATDANRSPSRSTEMRNAVLMNGKSLEQYSCVVSLLSNGIQNVPPKQQLAILNTSPLQNYLCLCSTKNLQNRLRKEVSRVQ